MDLQRVNNLSTWKKLLSKKYTLMVPRDARGWSDSQEVRGRLTRPNSQMGKSNVKEDCALEIDRWAGNWQAKCPICTSRSSERLAEESSRALAPERQLGSDGQALQGCRCLTSCRRAPGSATLQRRRRMQRRKGRRMTSEEAPRCSLLVSWSRDMGQQTVSRVLVDSRV